MFSTATQRIRLAAISRQSSLANATQGLTILLLLAVASGCSKPTAKPAQVAENESEAAEETIDPQFLLSKMRATYQNAKSYTDNSSFVFYAIVRSSGGEKEIPFTRISVALERPNRFHLTYKKDISSANEESYEVASDGRVIRSTADEISSQVHEAIAPANLTAENFIPEPALRGAILANSIENTLPQMALLLTKDGAQTIFPGEEKARTLQSGAIDGKPYHRVELPSPAGKRVLWIDPDTFTLRRMDLPIDDQRKQLNAGNQFSDISVWIDFEDVTLNPELEPDLFTLELPEGARRVRRFIPPPPAGPPEILGKPVGQFVFKSLEGDSVTPETLSGKVTILDFWSTVCQPCKVHTPVLNKVYQEFQSNENVEFLAVSTDSRVVPNETLENTLRNWGGEMTIVRDSKSSGYHDLNVRQTPTLMLVDSKGRLQSFQVGAHRNAKPIIDAVQRLLDGENIVATDREKHAGFLVKYEEALDAAEIQDSIVEVEVVQPKIGERKLPRQLKLKKLWQTSTEQIARPGDMQILAHETGGPSIRMISLDGGEAIVELNSSTGEVIARHELPKHDEQRPGFLRSWSNNKGEHTYLVSGVGWQKVYVWNNNWEQVLSFPDEPHSGIGDVLFDDLTGSGTPVMYVGYWGGLGIQGGTLDGRRVWSNRRLDHVLQIGTGPTIEKKGESKGEIEASETRTTWCTSTRGTLTQMGPTGKSIRELYVEGQALMYFASRSSGDQHCGLAIGKAGHYTAVGFDNQGTVAWEYPLPPGEYIEPLSRIQSVQMPDGAPAWLIVAANGSLHWLDQDGQLIDRFDYGEILTGLSLQTLGDQTVLFASTAKHLTAWQVDLPAVEPSNDDAESDETNPAEPSSLESAESTSSDSTETPEQ